MGRQSPSLWGNPLLGKWVFFYQYQHPTNCIFANHLHLLHYEISHWNQDFKFLRDGTADEALRQIEEKGYARPYAADKRPVRKIGVVFSSQTGTIEEWKEA